MYREIQMNKDTPQGLHRALHISKYMYWNFAKIDISRHFKGFHGAFRSPRAAEIQIFWLKCQFLREISKKIPILGKTTWEGLRYILEYNCKRLTQTLIVCS